MFSLCCAIILEVLQGGDASENIVWLRQLLSESDLNSSLTSPLLTTTHLDCLAQLQLLIDQFDEPLVQHPSFPSPRQTPEQNEATMLEITKFFTSLFTTPQATPDLLQQLLSLVEGKSALPDLEGTLVVVAVGLVGFVVYCWFCWLCCWLVIGWRLVMFVDFGTYKAKVGLALQAKSLHPASTLSPNRLAASSPN